MSATILVAHDRNRVIGKGNSIPWRIAEDLRKFKQRTTGHSVIMGRKTWESIPLKFRPLPGRHNFIVSRSYHSDPDKFMASMPVLEGPTDTWVVNSLESAIALAEQIDATRQKFIIGGGQIYEEAIRRNLADRVVVSLVHGEFEGDTFFPELDSSWTCQELESYVEFSELEFTVGIPTTLQNRKFS